MGLFPEKPIFAKNQYDRLANIFDNAGQVIFGVAVLTPSISGFASLNQFMLLSGVIGALASWFVSVLLARKGK